MKPVISHPAADRDWQSTASFYSDRKNKLARDFNERSDYIWVLAVAHAKRYPGFWADRLAD